ncbi:hypothetical protein AYJ57_09800 [Salipiger sp. CCB-MM3]|uniref:ion channel n=1 Tax=Salipiger sp. CCB-MM3 TaxID=1792508 RepID=UPI00080AB7E7|nr:ion channel [Salipiger sp. CCB-MM3]ANT60633.1 hypothetical protein AYJ57_09800 [Salipiger sp. CCB-MM3]
MTAYLIGIAFMLLTACLHHALLVLATSSVPDRLRSSKALPITVFGLLALIHLIEILAGGGVYLALHRTLYPEGFGGSFSGTWNDYVYFSGMNFTTLGQTGMQVSGPLRIVAMMQALAGFMVLTWSASYLYGACRQQFVGEYEQSREG